MRTLFVSGEMISGDLPWRLQNEGCEVKLFVEHPEQYEVLEGFVPRIKDWKKELSWVGKDGLIVFDDVGYGIEQDQLRRDGYTVFGGCREGDRLEQSRTFCNDILRSCGFNVAPIFDFSLPQEAIRHITHNPRRWVIKQNSHQSALNFVGTREDGSDIKALLALYEKQGLTNVSLQWYIDGVEIGVARYFNGRSWVGPIEYNVEHKALFPGDIGPKTGEMGTVMWYDSDETMPLYQQTLAHLEAYLKKIDYRGDVDINVFINNQTITPIELTMRLGCPSTHMQTTLHLSPWRELLYAVARGQEYDLLYRQGYGVVLTLALPPFPYEGQIDSGYLSEGLPIFFDEMSADERKRIHFEGVRRNIVGGEEKLIVSHSIGYTIFVSGIGASIQEARTSALNLAQKIHIPRIFYRNDIGVKFEETGFKLLKQWGWL